MSKNFDYTRIVRKAVNIIGPLSFFGIYGSLIMAVWVGIDGFPQKLLISSVLTFIVCLILDKGMEMVDEDYRKEKWKDQ